MKKENQKKLKHRNKADETEQNRGSDKTEPSAET